VLEEFEVKGFASNESQICGISGIYENQSMNFMGRYIIGADGAHSITAKRLNLNNDEPRHRAFGMRAYFENVEGLDKCIEIHYEESILPGYGWIFDMGGGKANVGVGVFNRFVSSKGIKNIFMRFIEKNSYAKEKLKKANMIKNSLKGWPIPCGSFPSKRSAGNVMFIGDAGSFVDPLTGEGIYYALRSGEYASQAISTALTHPNIAKSAGYVYEKLWGREFKWKEYRMGYLLQPLLNNKFLINFTIHRASKKKKKAEKIVGVIGHKLPKTKLLLNI
jgi:flavin-dependent dehydrogenase